MAARAIHSHHHRRKGAIDLPFNWLFIMIAGGAILLTTFYFVQKQQKAYTEEISQLVLRDLGAITSGAQTAKGTSQLIDIPESDISFTCTLECTCGLTIGSVTTSLKDNLLFGQDKIKGTKITLWAQDWSIPLRVTNFLFVTTPRIKYYLLHRPGSKLAQAFKERIPDNLNITFVTETGLDPRNARLEGQPIDDVGYDAVRFVMLDDRPSAGLAPCNLRASFKDKDASCVSIKPDQRTAGITNAYDIAIQDKIPGQAKTYRVIGETAVLAAIFADTSHQFTCTMQKAYSRLSLLANLTAARSDLLETQRIKPGSTLCTGIPYFVMNPPAANPFITLAKAAKSLTTLDLNDFTNSLTPNPAIPSDAAITTIHTSLVTILTKNQDLLRQDCPLLY